MLYVIHQANHPELTYQGGQEPIVHLEADLQEVVAWAKSIGRRWAFTVSNAGAAYAQFYGPFDRLDEIDWGSVSAKDWRDPQVKEGEQAEFLVHESFPWRLVSRLGVRSMQMRSRVAETIKLAQHQPKIDVKPDWYY